MGVLSMRMMVRELYSNSPTVGTNTRSVNKNSVIVKLFYILCLIK